MEAPYSKWQLDWGHAQNGPTPLSLIVIKQKILRVIYSVYDARRGVTNWTELVLLIEGSEFAFKSCVCLSCIQCPSSSCHDIVCKRDKGTFWRQTRNPQLKGRGLIRARHLIEGNILCFTSKYAPLFAERRSKTLTALAYFFFIAHYKSAACTYNSARLCFRSAP